ncbi:type II secretion system protein M [Pseudomonas sp.]|uniref:type II secretion system protein M n=1 Tax=Pseudomonas sp. TaxID=306 RepID=UPI003BB7F8D7
MVSQGKGFQLDNSLLLQRWRALAPREQFSLGSLAAFLLLVLLYLTLWQPAQERLAAARSAFAAQRELNAYLHSQAPAARNLASTPQQAIDPERLQGMVTATAATQGLTIERLDNAGDGAVQLNLQPAPFAQLLRWFTVLQEQGVQIAEAGLDRAEDNKVAARLSLRVAQ